MVQQKTPATVLVLVCVCQRVCSERNENDPSSTVRSSEAFSWNGGSVLRTVAKNVDKILLHQEMLTGKGSLFDHADKNSVIFFICKGLFHMKLAK